MILVLLLLSGCMNTPETVSIQSTVDAAVSTALAPYEEKYDKFITDEDLEASQDEQNVQIQQYIQEHIERAMDSIEQDVPVVPTVPAAENPVTIIYKDGAKTTATPTYDSIDNTNCVDRFTYVSDLTIPDGMTITPNTRFQKQWYITNSGTCTWNSNYKIVYNSGDNVGSSKSFPMLQEGYCIRPGESTVVSASLVAPSQPHSSYSTYWAVESDTGEKFGAGEAKNVYLSSSFRVEPTFYLSQNFGSLKCSDQFGPITCGTLNSDNSRGSIYFDDTLMTENRRSPGVPGLAVKPPAGENTITRFEFGPLRFPRESHFYTNFCCRADAPLCDVQVRLYVREPGYGERLVEEARKFYDGLFKEFKFMLDDREIFDQEFYYILEVQTNGGSEDDTIMFWNTKLY